MTGSSLSGGLPLPVSTACVQSATALIGAAVGFPNLLIAAPYTNEAPERL
jgi:hypothetical protein